MRQFEFTPEQRGDISQHLRFGGAAEDSIEVVIEVVEAFAMRDRETLMASYFAGIANRASAIRQLSEELHRQLSEVENPFDRAHVMGVFNEQASHRMTPDGPATSGGLTDFAMLLALLEKLKVGATGSEAFVREQILPFVGAGPRKRGRALDEFGRTLCHWYLSTVDQHCGLPLEDRLGRSPDWLVGGFAAILRAAHPGNRDDRLTAQRLIREVRPDLPL